MLSGQNVKKTNGDKAWSMHVSRFHPSALFSRFEALHIRKRLERRPGRLSAAHWRFLTSHAAVPVKSTRNAAVGS